MAAKLDVNQDQTAVESLLYQRLIIFLIVFSVFVLAAVNAPRKLLFLSILFLGVLICWVLTFILIRTAKRLDDKAGGRLVRLVLGYMVPIFCSLFLTASLFLGSMGVADYYLFPSNIKPAQIENKINQLKDAVVKQIAPPPKNSPANFKSVDSVIADSKVIRSGKKVDNLKPILPEEKSLVQRTITDSKVIKKADSSLVKGKAGSVTTPPAKSKPKAVPFLKPGKDSKIFKEIDSVISKEK